MKRILWLSNKKPAPVVPLNPYFVDYQSRIDMIFPEPYKTYFNTFFQQLDDAGIIQLLDVLRVYANISRDAALTNMANAFFKATEVGAPDFIAYNGYTGGVGQYLISDFNQLNDSVNYTLNSSLMFVRSNTSNMDIGYACGISLAGNATYIQPYNSGTTSYATMNTGSGSLISSPSVSGIGLFLLNRTNSTTENLYQDNILQASTAVTPSTALVNETFNELCLGPAGLFSTTQQQSVFGLGSGSINHTDLYNIVSTLLTSLAL